jgi:hypothetical protein
MALDKTFSVGEVLSASDANSYLLGLWTPIDKIVATSGGALSSFSFSGISSAFRMFRLSYYLTHVGGSTSSRIRLNNDSGTNYAFQLVSGDGATVTGQRQASITSFPGSLEAAIPALGQWIIAKPSTGVEGYMTGNVAYHNPTTVRTGNIAGSWNNTASLINRIDVVILNGTAYGVVALEGVRGI